ncbi:ABC transporter ATP-binding protein [Halobacteria archaeon AArc-curdl1]|uniref:ABC transporter ATP-binding protein n=1 Tax=Natronosalvus hydrolyticus TaxID=2979988 RepID=A0AAP3E634_9EURY|nr:ABC transporter ATP-binding protein [Halobacteria archaeon AArc-curdl1]
MSVLRVSGLEKSFGSVQALSGMTFEVAAGELFGFLGPNGAGKTTTIALVTGQLVPDSGEISVLGVDPTEEPLEARRRVGILPEKQSPPSFLTPREYFEFVGQIRGLEPETLADRVEEWVDRLGFRGKLDTLHTDLSRGQQQKVMITQAFLHEPKLVCIDEPLANLDPIVQEQVKSFLQAYCADGNTIFVSTHNIEVAESICTRVGIVADGTCLTVETLPLADGSSLRDRFIDTVSNQEPRDMPQRVETEDAPTPE